MQNKIKEYRKNKKMSQYKLADKSGITRPYISKLENGKCTVINSSTMLAIANALEATVAEIFFEEQVHHSEQEEL